MRSLPRKELPRNELSRICDVDVEVALSIDDIPHLKWYGVDEEYHVMVIDLLGPILEKLFTSCNRKFSMKTILMLTDQPSSSSIPYSIVNFLKFDTSL
ncbi:hypothetical protein ZEAMMB73_Zm00001d020616 [Zea mays]|uniref:Uncharacterized protein n=1 Tax=Zea mays TaxID=4577 RepID=A0A1D6I581_MAIZE|nr:hypothetical protein ZEAMMB73_Zm00001d020616 [Zea mays]